MMEYAIAVLASVWVYLTDPAYRQHVKELYALADEGYQTQIVDAGFEHLYPGGRKYWTKRFVEQWLEQEYVHAQTRARR